MKSVSVIVLALFATAAVIAQARMRPGQWEVSTQMAMPNMPAGFQMPVQRRRQSQGERLSQEWCHNATTVPLEGSGRYDEKVSSGVDAMAYRSTSSPRPEPACSGRFPVWLRAMSYPDHRRKGVAPLPARRLGPACATLRPGTGRSMIL